MKRIELVVLSIALGCLVATCDSERSTDDRIEPDVAMESSELLHNGIRLVGDWPPRTLNQDSRAPMPVPYLVSPPEVIPIDVGRQLFVDDFLISSSTLERIYHRPLYHPSNPVLSFEEPWELLDNPKSGLRADIDEDHTVAEQGTIAGKAMAAPFSDGMWYDPADSKFKLWYMGGGLETTCYAESRDGINWEKPDLDVEPGTNVVLREMRDSTTVWLDHYAQEVDRRYLIFSVWEPWQYSLRFSSDGIHWSEPVAKSHRVNDRSTVYYDPFRSKWVASIRTDGRRRDYHESDDPAALLQWEDGDRVHWLSADELDPVNPAYPEVEPQLYNHDAVAYESLMLGYFSVWQGPSNAIAQEAGHPKRNEVLIGYSRDGFHWHRPDRRPFLGVNELPGAWNWGNIQSVGGGCAVVGDELYFYVSGRERNEISWDGYMSTGLATLRRDGFASLGADSQGGTITTRPVKFDGKYLFVNVSTEGGTLRAEILDENGAVIEPYSLQNSVPISEDSTLVRVEWAGTNDLSEISGQPVRFRFSLTGGSIFSFWVSADLNGASNGFVCGGGPGFSSDRDTAGIGAYEAARQLNQQTK